ncbi:hypothetical protein BH09VER1_BH09VER1_33720 [soil metagenome]
MKCLANSPEYSAIILAAGFSSRMGRDKASLSWLGGRSLLEWTVEALREGGWNPIVVLGPHNHAAWGDYFPKEMLVLNPDPGRGKTSSIATGVSVLSSSAKYILFAGVDQPRPPVVYRLLNEAAHPDRIVAPGDGAHRDHPIVVGARWRKQLLALNEQAEGLRGLMDANRESLARVPCDPEWLRWDCNTPDAYEAALEWFRKSA